MISVRQVHPHIGAEIEGVDLSRSLDGATFAAVRDAFNQHSVLVFRNQQLTDAEQVAFSERFGELEKTSFAVGADDRFVYKLSKIDDAGDVLVEGSEKRNFLIINRRWHSDSSFRPIPAMASILSGREIPAQDAGDTNFASMRVGYETLPESRRAAIEGLVAYHHFAYSVGLFDNTGVTEEELAALPPVPHPVIRSHPGTGKLSLYVSGHIERIEGMPWKRAANWPKSWSSGVRGPDLSTSTNGGNTIWSCGITAAALHCVTDIPTHGRRIMHRTTVAGDGRSN